MGTLIFAALFVLAVILLVMYLSPRFRERVTTGWGVIGAWLAALFAFLATWFAGSPPTLPPA